MCIICLEYQRTKDRSDAFKMLQAAYREPGAIDKEHLKQVTIDLVGEEFREGLKGFIGQQNGKEAQERIKQAISELEDETRRTHNLD